MSRFFNNQQVELLAPAGTFEIFKKVIQSGADAVYFGGKILNMRMHRKDYNFTNEEIVEAVKIAHSLDKKVYITVNNLFGQQDLKDAENYLRFLERVQVDALIIQDFSIFEFIKTLNLNLNLHSSVMMNVHNLETIKTLKNLGITRVVASREIDLKTIKTLYSQTNMEFEYFVHGDMCVVHGAQCLYSGMLFGKSSNRGHCMKPCRWNFKIKKDGFVYDTKYPMAVKDMCMYEHIPELIEAGVVSFKIEGRMRDSEYLLKLINYYSDAIDRYINDPICYDRKKHFSYIYENRKRDLSTAYAFGKPGIKNINRRYEGTGKFYSHGKVFSKPIEEFELTGTRINEIKHTLNKNTTSSKKPIISVKVNSYEQAKAALAEDVDTVYLSGDVFQPDKPFNKNEILELTKNKKNTKIYLGLPRMMFEQDFSKYNHLLTNNQLNIDGLLVTNLGALHKFKNLNLDLVGDYCLNIYNQKAANFYKKQGLSTATLSVEAPLLDAAETIKHSPIPMEMIVHGSPVVMYLEHDLYENLNIYKPIGKENNLHTNNKVLVLVDDKGYEHPVFRDNQGRNHIILYKDLCYLPILKELNNNGLNRFRIEGCHYNVEELIKIIRTYKCAIDDLTQCENLFKNFSPTYAGFTFGAFQFN
ncbi:peptidase U32 family protein [Haloimpatiens sp. FM7330]|uniref:peptidase U32 family protein n=1 Tax=Haloimpatiens sp. FM7330 TaxID=3298610 RepID=UPI00362FF021